MAQQQNNDNQMWLRKEARDIFTRVANTIIMRGGKEGKIPNITDVCLEARKVSDSAFSFYPEPEVEETKSENAFDVKLPVIEK